MGAPSGPSPKPPPHLLKPAAPQIWGSGQLPHWMALPQPSPFSPQSKPCCWQVMGVHDASIVGASPASLASTGASTLLSTDDSSGPSSEASGACSSSSMTRPVRLPHATTATSDATATANNLLAYAA